MGPLLIILMHSIYYFIFRSKTKSIFLKLMLDLDITHMYFVKFEFRLESLKMVPGLNPSWLHSRSNPFMSLIRGSVDYIIPWKHSPTSALSQITLLYRELLFVYLFLQSWTIGLMWSLSHNHSNQLQLGKKHNAIVSNKKVVKLFA